ncbi:hypothetical protein AB0L75_24690 [Streptomyces sp. NPDC052101]|uniref:hypothetical protein n=1 Tax=Streptomyces sp. NPDC052101 TaxID=3155763 RepID=UPI0034299D32
MNKKQSASAPGPADAGGEGESPNRRLGLAEAAVVIVIVVASAVLAAIGMPMVSVLKLLFGAGLIAAVVIVVIHTGVSHRILRALRALAGPTE